MAPQSCLWKTKLLFILMSWWTVVCLVTQVCFKLKFHLQVYWSSKLVNAAVNSATTKSTWAGSEPKPWDQWHALEKTRTPHSTFVVEGFPKTNFHVVVQSDWSGKARLKNQPWTKILVSLRFVNRLFIVWGRSTTWLPRAITPSSRILLYSIISSGYLNSPQHWEQEINYSPIRPIEFHLFWPSKTWTIFAEHLNTFKF